MSSSLQLRPLWDFTGEYPSHDATGELWKEGNDTEQEFADEETPNGPPGLKVIPPKKIARCRPTSPSLPRQKFESASAEQPADSTSTVQESVPTAPVAHQMDYPEAEGFIILKKYEGVILKRSEETFWARIHENRSDYPNIEAEFDLAELPESDRIIATAGAPIVWTFGYEVDRGTRTRRSSILYVRRLLGPSRSEIARSKAKIEAMIGGITWD